MNNRYSIPLLLTAALALLSATASFAADDGQVYFIQHSFYAYKNKYVTTNYHVGTLIPINTRAIITDMGGKSMEIELPGLDNMEIEISNVEKHTHKSMKEIKDRLFGTSEVDLKKFSKDTQEAIKSGQLKVGMTKAEVLLAYGYPPAHATPSTDDNQWTYWKNRWNRIVLDFKDDKLIGIRD